jgi:hypothetical protein
MCSAFIVFVYVLNVFAVLWKFLKFSHVLPSLRGQRGSEAEYIAYPPQNPASHSSGGPSYHKRGSGDSMGNAHSNLAGTVPCGDGIPGISGYGASGQLPEHSEFKTVSNKSTR